MDEPRSSGGEWVLFALYTVAVGMNVYIIVDQVTDGQLTRHCSLLYYRWKGRVSESRERRRQFRQASGHVVWEAMKITGEVEG